MMTLMKNRFLLMLALILSLAAADRFVPRRIGDHLQYALPVAGLGCAALSGGALPYLGRFIGFELILNGSKNSLGATAVNIRPDGHLRGFPSGHTGAATFGAVGLSQTCLAASPPAALLALGAAGFTGASRVWAGRHTVVQVLAGFALGWAMQFLGFAWLARLSRRALAGSRNRLRPTKKGAPEGAPLSVRPGRPQASEPSIS